MGLTMLQGRNLPKALWGDAIHTIVHIFNITKTKVVADKTPYEAYYGKKPAISHFLSFGSKGLVHSIRMLAPSLIPRSQGVSSTGTVKNPRHTASSTW